MKFKILEVRDEGTHIPALAIKMLAEDDVQSYYVHDRCGYPRDGTGIVLCRLNDMSGHVDPYAWTDSPRTMATAHHHVYEHFDELNDGDVIDVQVLLGETTEPVRSDRLR